MRHVKSTAARREAGGPPRSCPPPHALEHIRVGQDCVCIRTDICGGQVAAQRYCRHAREGVRKYCVCSVKKSVHLEKEKKKRE